MTIAALAAAALAAYLTASVLVSLAIGRALNRLAGHPTTELADLDELADAA